MIILCLTIIITYLFFNNYVNSNFQKISLITLRRLDCYLEMKRLYFCSLLELKKQFYCFVLIADFQYILARETDTAFSPKTRVRG